MVAYEPRLKAFQAMLHEIVPGAFPSPQSVSIDAQRTLAERGRVLMDGDVPPSVPVVRGGGKMHARMSCLGRHWNGVTSRHEPTRSDFDGQPAPRLPDEFRSL